MGTHVISETSCIKLLGLYLDNSLTFNDHVRHMCDKISKTTGVLYRLRNSLPGDVLRKIYQSLIEPYTSYSIDAWYTDCETHMKRIVTLQKNPYD